MPENNNPPTVTFVQHALPPLKAGSYTVQSTQQVQLQDSNSTQQQYTSSQDFLVQGLRYRLQGPEVSSVFPPMGVQGEYINVLPQIVLTQPTLPWQRELSPGQAAPSGTQDVPPWMALLLFDQQDPVPEVQALTLGDLAAQNTTFFPPQTLEEGQQPTDPVNVIDVPLTLFNNIAPSLADMPWLAHVRHTDNEKKAMQGENAPGTDYAVILGNRLPTSANKSVVHLVSLEGYGPYLPNSNGTASANLPDSIGLVRLVSLYSWEFRCNDMSQTFSGLLEAEALAPQGLQMPFDATQSAGNQAYVSNAFEMGYTALNHELRNGSTTVSWYRGPLLPYGTTPFVNVPNQDSDQLMRYDPTLGLYDASYAAAWNLGRTMALHDKQFATTLYRYKQEHMQDTVNQLELSILANEFGQNIDQAQLQARSVRGNTLNHSGMEQLIKSRLGNLGKTLKKKR